MVPMHTIAHNQNNVSCFPVEIGFYRGGRSANWADGRCQFTNAAERAVSISNAGGMVGGKRGHRALCKGPGGRGGSSTDEDRGMVD